MKISRYASIFFIVFSCMLSCSKEEITTRTYPRVVTVSATISGSTITFNGEIIYTPGEIIDYGFVWTATGFPTLTNGSVKSFGIKSSTGSFNTSVNGLLSAKQYSLRAFAKTSHNVVYGETLSFVTTK